MKNQPPRLYGGNLKTKKTKNMPLGPKQQPPYYVPETLPTPSTGGTTRLNTQFATVTTTGTTETNLYTYTMPANTLTNNGDTINIIFNTIQTAAADHITRFHIAGIEEWTITDPLAQNGQFKIQIIKIASDTVRMIFNHVADSSSITADHQDETGLDFTTPIAILFTGECPTAGTIQTYSLTIDKTST